MEQITRSLPIFRGKHPSRLVWALVLSLLVHVVLVYGEAVVHWIRYGQAPQEVVTPTLRKLADVDLQSTPQTPAELQGVKTPEVQTVSLRFLTAPVSPSPAAASVDPPRSGTKIPARAATGKTLKKSPVTPPDTSTLVASAVESHSRLRTAGAVQAAEAGHDKEHPEETKALPFPKSLRVTYVAGPLPIEMEWKVASGQYTLQMRSQALTDIAYKSRGTVGKNGLRPQQFQEIRKSNLKYQVDFDWTNHQVHIGEPGAQVIETLPRGTQDMFSAGFQLALLGSHLKNFTFSVVTSRKMYADVPFAIQGETRIQVGKIWVDTLLLKGVYNERRFEFWLAPDWGNIPVRIGIDTDKGHYTATAVRVVADGKTLAEPASQLDQKPAFAKKEK